MRSLPRPPLRARLAVIARGLATCALAVVTATCTSSGAAGCGGGRATSAADASSPMEDGGSSPGPTEGDAAAVSDAPGADPLACPVVTAGVAKGNVSDPAITEASGLAASHAHPGVLWTHNDSGDTARVFAIGAAGERLGTYALTGATADDWEDLALGPSPSAAGDHLYAADTGDNAEARTSVTLYRFPEPAVTAGQAPASVDVATFETIVVTYGDGKPHNAEAVFVDPATGDLAIVTKEYAARGLLFTSKPIAKGTAKVTLDLSGTLILGATTADGATRPAGVPAVSAATGGAAHARGVLLRTTSQLFFHPRAPGEPLAAAFGHPPCEMPLAKEPQGEAVSFAADGKGYFTLSEGTGATLFFYEER